MTATEQDIKSALDGHFYRLDWAKGDTIDRIVPLTFLPEHKAPTEPAVIERMNPDNETTREIARMLGRGISAKTISFRLGVSRYAVYAIKSRIEQ